MSDYDLAVASSLRVQVAAADSPLMGIPGAWSTGPANRSAAPAMPDDQREALSVRLEAAAGATHERWSAYLAAKELRDDLIVEAYEGGWTTIEIGRRAGIGASRVTAIVAAT